MDVPKYIRLHGEQILVSNEVYELYHKTARKARYFAKELKYRKIRVDAKNESVLYVPAREDSLERLMDDNGEQFSDTSVHVEDEACFAIMCDALHQALSQLEAQERQLIQALYFEQKTERQWAAEIGVPRMTMHDQKVRILEKLKRLLEK